MTNRISLAELDPGAATEGQAVVVGPGGQLEPGNAGLDAEAVRDTIAAALVQGVGVQITVDDAAETITIAVTPDSTRLAPLTTTVGGVPQLVWNEDDNLVMTEVPL